MTNTITVNQNYFLIFVCWLQQKWAVYEARQTAIVEHWHQQQNFTLDIHFNTEKKNLFLVYQDIAEILFNLYKDQLTFQVGARARTEK